MIPPIVMIFERDLRFDDSPALQAACAAARASGAGLIPVFVLDRESPDMAPPGGAVLRRLRDSLHKFAAEIAKDGGRLVFRTGPLADTLEQMLQQSNARAVFRHTVYEPAARARDAAVAAVCARHGAEHTALNGSLLLQPEDVLNGGGTFFKVFTPYWRACLKHEIRLPIDPPTGPLPWIPAADLHTYADDFAPDDFLPRVPWDAEFIDDTGEAAAHALLARFINESLEVYKEGRNFPAQPHVSGLSPHLHAGEISPNRMFYAAQNPLAVAGVDHFRSELGWREFSYHLLHHAPHLPERAFRPEFEAFPFRNAPDDMQAWYDGRTGYPIVDAGMRQLRRTGRMHNRVRMITASFAVKHLLLSRVACQAWFYDNLVDADLASNSASWQWVAGSGADAAPYFRIFNPILQGTRFDPDGAYVRRWVPEIAHRSDADVHAPYGRPIVNLDFGRKRALDALQRCSPSGA